MRINFNPSATRAGYHIPKYATELINALIIAFCQDYQISNDDAYHYFFGNSSGISTKTGPDIDSMNRLVELLNNNGISASSYTVDNLPSIGIIIEDNDPILVEYKLKFGT